MSTRAISRSWWVARISAPAPAASTPRWPWRRRGVRCVIAEFYARIFYRNSINGGYLVPLESKSRLVEQVHTGDELEVHLLDGYVLNKTRKQRYELNPLGDVLPIIESGGVFAYARKAGMLK